ncbi:hypothetical protein [Nitratidesulfovibrio vulgaris]|jgi:hypothetical protein|uniref:hypothetical protein n=1 Tax=Nitratidesulfovibrio vulgaris TaxID=881 RepID=UPI001CC0B481|nr:hypothetical protein [Nitratidesulfovibrio vulgaris]WCB45808.1 hypothetical protein PH214_12220 [Nitratidesulfovibrio vulgaris]
MCRVYKWLRVLLELLPLQVFALSWRLEGATAPGGWQLPYGLAALTAVVCIGILVWRRVLLDRLLLGVNAAIILGALGLYCGTPGLPKLLADIRGAGVFAVVLLTAGVTYLARPAALLDFERGTWEPWDRYMLLAVFIAFWLAFATREEPLVGAMLLGALFVVRTMLQQAARRW